MEIGTNRSLYHRSVIKCVIFYSIFGMDFGAPKLTETYILSIVKVFGMRLRQHVTKICGFRENIE